MARPPSDANLRAISAVDAFRLKPPPAVKKFLQDEGLLPVIPERTERSGCIEKRLKRAGIYDQATAWRKDAAERLKHAFTGNSWNIPREICWRLVEAKAAQMSAAWLAIAQTINATPLTNNPYFDKLPPDIKWVYGHPGTGAANRDDPAVKDACAKYEEANPCPSDGARVRYNFNGIDGKATIEFFKQVDRLMLAMQKEKTKPTGDLNDIEEEENIAELESQLHSQMQNWNA